jgi:hypothetical protein
MRTNLTILLLLPFLAHAHSEHNSIRIHMTDLWSSLTWDSLDSFADKQAIVLETEFVGSFVALEALQAGLIDAALLALPSIEDVDLSAYTAQPVAYTAARVQVHTVNPIQELSYRELQAIFDGHEQKRIKHWNKLAEDASFLGVIRPYIVSDKAAIIDDLFRYSVFPNGYLAEEIPIITQEDYKQKVLSEYNSICILPGRPEENQSKSLKIRSKDENAAYELNTFNLYYNDYPIALTYYLVCQNDLIAEQLIPYFYGQKFEQLMARSGYYALPDLIRK